MPVPAHPATETRASPADLFEIIVVRAGTVLFAIDVQAAVEIRGRRDSALQTTMADRPWRSVGNRYPSSTCAA